MINFEKIWLNFVNLFNSGFTLLKQSWDIIVLFVVYCVNFVKSKITLKNQLWLIAFALLFHALIDPFYLNNAYLVITFFHNMLQNDPFSVSILAEYTAAHHTSINLTINVSHWLTDLVQAFCGPKVVPVILSSVQDVYLFIANYSAIPIQGLDLQLRFTGPDAANIFRVIADNMISIHQPLPFAAFTVRQFEVMLSLIFFVLALASSFNLISLKVVYAGINILTPVLFGANVILLAFIADILFELVTLSWFFTNASAEGGPDSAPDPVPAPADAPAPAPSAAPNEAYLQGKLKLVLHVAPGMTIEASIKARTPLSALRFGDELEGPGLPSPGFSPSTGAENVTRSNIFQEKNQGSTSSSGPSSSLIFVPTPYMLRLSSQLLLSILFPVIGYFWSLRNFIVLSADILHWLLAPVFSFFEAMLESLKGVLRGININFNFMYRRLTILLSVTVLSYFCIFVTSAEASPSGAFLPSSAALPKDFIIYVSILTILVPVLLVVAFLTLAERQLMASIQRRVGPQVSGFGGILQPFWDGLKLGVKEPLLPELSASGAFAAAPIISFILSQIAWVPLFLADASFGGLVIMALSSLSVYGVMLAGWASNSKYAFLGCLRSVALMVSYELSLGACLLSIALFTVDSTGIKCINFVELPDVPLLALLPVCHIFLVCILAETKRVPFDLPEAEAELVAGYNVEYSALGFALFFIAEYANIAVMSAIASIYFLGGFSALKIAILFFGFVWTRGSLPRYRYDQFIRLGWKALLPLSLALFGFYACFDWLVA